MMNEVPGRRTSGHHERDHERESLPDIDSDQPAEWEDGDRLNEAFAALSDDLLEWAEHHAEMNDWTDEGWRGDRPE